MLILWRIFVGLVLDGVGVWGSIEDMFFAGIWTLRCDVVVFVLVQSYGGVRLTAFSISLNKYSIA